MNDQETPQLEVTSKHPGTFPTPTVTIQAKTWECPTHKRTLLQEDACPDCGKQLLLG